MQMSVLYFRRIILILISLVLWDVQRILFFFLI